MRSFLGKFQHRFCQWWVVLRYLYRHLTLGLKISGRSSDYCLTITVPLNGSILWDRCNPRITACPDHIFYIIRVRWCKGRREFLCIAFVNCQICLVQSNSIKWNCYYRDFIQVCAGTVIVAVIIISGYPTILRPHKIGCESVWIVTFLYNLDNFTFPDISIRR